MFPQRRPATQGVLSAASGPAIVFLSYAHEDREFALRLNDTLHLNGIQVHGDWELVRGENYEQQLQDLQTGSDATIVVLSPRMGRKPEQLPLSPPVTLVTSV